MSFFVQFVLNFFLIELPTRIICYGFTQSEIETITAPPPDLKDETEKENYNALRATGFLGPAVQSFIIYIWSTKDIRAQKDLCKELYQTESRFHQNEAETGQFIMHKIGTNDSTSRFLDLERKSLSVKIESFLCKTLHHKIYRLVHNLNAMRVIAAAKSFLRVVLYYTDVAKDVYLAALIYTQVITQPGGFIFTGEASFPTAVFFAVVVSVSATEICNLLTLVSHPEFRTWAKTKRVLTATLWFLLPAYLIFDEFLHEMWLIFEVGKMREVERREKGSSLTWQNFVAAKLATTKNNIHRIRALLFELRANDNSFEHFVQFTVLSAIVLFSRTSSPIVAGFNKVFIEEGSYLFVLSALTSLWSLVRGPIAYLSSRKNGFMGFTATLLLIPYFAVGVVTRLFAALLLLTPDLGLFDTMHHYTKGRLEMDRNSGYAIMFDPDENISFYELWDDNYRMRTFGSFMNVPPNFSIAIAASIFAAHLIVSFFLLLPLYKRSGDGPTRRFLRGIFTFVNVPLFCDWEVFYRESDLTMPVAECWAKSKELYVKFHGLFIIENYVALTPLILLKNAVDQRNAQLNGSIFKPVPDEILSTQRVDMVLALGFVVPIVGSLLQTAIAYAYFRFGHPWARLLESKVFASLPGGRNFDQSKNAHEDDGFFNEVLSELAFPFDQPAKTTEYAHSTHSQSETVSNNDEISGAGAITGEEENEDNDGVSLCGSTDRYDEERVNTITIRAEIEMRSNM